MRFPWAVVKAIARRSRLWRIDCGAEVVVVPSEGLPSDPEAGLVGDDLDEVEGGMAVEFHVGWAAVDPQAHQIVVEDDVEHPVEAVFDAPMGADGAGESRCVEVGGGGVVAPRGGRAAGTFDDALDHADHGEAGKARFAGKAAVGDEPCDVGGDAVSPDLDATVIAVGGLVGVEGGVRLAVEEEVNLVGEGGPIVLEGEEMVGATSGTRRRRTRLPTRSTCSN